MINYVVFVIIKFENIDQLCNTLIYLLVSKKKGVKRGKNTHNMHLIRA